MKEWMKSYYGFLGDKWKNRLVDVFLSYWWVIVLIGIFMFSYYIRAMNNIPDRLLSFDPIFQYRYTKYIVEWGHMPLWDEISYYVGKAIHSNINPPLLYYITAIAYFFLKDTHSLLTVCSYMGALFGALITIPAFLLGRELSNKYGGLFAAILIGTAPKILTRTFGASFDSDQIVLFFLLLTLYLGYYAFKKKTIGSYSMALLGLTAFMLTWMIWVYSFVIIMGFVFAYFVLKFVLNRFKIKGSEIKAGLKYIAVLVIGLLLIGFVVNQELSLINVLGEFLGFVSSPEEKIVNISIAELQLFDIANIDGLITAFGGFQMINELVSNLVLLSFISLLGIGVYLMYKKGDIMALSFMLVLIIVGIYTTMRGHRFAEFSSTLLLVSVGSGFGLLFTHLKTRQFPKVLLLCLAILLSISVLNIGMAVGQQLGPDLNSNWDNAWEFLKTETDVNSIVGTWWDPGHMISGLAERRNIADGAHCSEPCLIGINERITDLGTIMVTDDENVSVELIRKYQGTSPEAYWIVSDDLIGKFRWPQYFSTGCDGAIDQSCPLYMQFPQTSENYDHEGYAVVKNYGNMGIYLGGNIPIPFLTEGINAAVVNEIIFYVDGEAHFFNTQTQGDKEIIISVIKGLEEPLNIRFSNESVPLTVWFSEDQRYIVIIPSNLRNSVFTRMFFLEGYGLEQFEQVFRNSQVKIYKVKE